MPNFNNAMVKSPYEKYLNPSITLSDLGTTSFLKYDFYRPPDKIYLSLSTLMRDKVDNPNINKADVNGKIGAETRIGKTAKPNL